MATNPMQRKARNSFMLGMLLMFLIAAIIIAFLVMLLMNERKKQQEIANAKTNVYVLTKDFAAGDTVTLKDIQLMKVDKSMVPADATGEKESLKKMLDLEEDENGNLKEKENSKPLTTKIALKANTVITEQMFLRNDIKDVRKQEYNVVVLPADLKTGEFIDIRFMLPSGQDYIVVSKKEVTIPEAGGTPLADTIWVDLREDETLMMDAAIIETFMINGAKLYATKYTEPALQEAAIPNYNPPKEVGDLVDNNPNILSTAKEELDKRFNSDNIKNEEDGLGFRDKYISDARKDAGEEGTTNVQTKMQESITNTKTTRKQYLDSLTGAVQ